MMILRNLAVFLFMIAALRLCSQSTRVRGTVVDARSGDPLPFVNLVFNTDRTGTASDTLGIFAMQTEANADSIIASAVGYKKQSYAIRPRISQRLDIRLQPDDYNLNEVVIRPGRNPAFRILDLVIKNKNGNNRPPQNMSWEEYEKFQIYFGNYSQRFIHRKQFKDYSFIFDHADTSREGKPLLPIFMSEQLRHCSTADGNRISRLLFAEKRSGETYEQLTSIADRLTENVNIYSNFFVILDKSFISPVNDNYQLYYKYYLEDSIIDGGKKYYRIRFVPKWKEDLAFSGDMLIHDTTFAIKEIALSINNEINLNYIRNFELKQEFTHSANRWILSKMETTATICPVKRRQTEEFTVQRLTSENNFRPADSIPVSETPASPIHKDDAFWVSARPDSLSAKEKYSYMIADTLDYVPVIKKIKKAVTVFASGYLDIGKIGIGQLHTFYSFNTVEQDRYKIGLRTNSKFSHKLQLDGYVAYGSSDRKFKYRAGMLWVPVKGDRRFSAGMSYFSDLIQPGTSSDHLQLDNILTSLTRTSAQTKLVFCKQYMAFAEKSWNNNLSSRLTIQNRTLQPVGDLRFDKLVNPEGNVIRHFDQIISSELIIETRISFQEKALETDFKKTYMPSRYPEINIQLAAGIKALLSDYDYQRVRIALSGKLRLNPAGYTLYRMEAGKIAGNIPYLLAEIHPGNQTLSLDREGFNLMNYFEFASDEYVSLSLDHHLDGFILNKIPLVKKAELREVISARAVAGSLHDNVKAEMLLPAEMKSLNIPYVECSVGLENIFKIVRIDYIWRVTQKNPVSTENWSIKAKLYFSF